MVTKVEICGSNDKPLEQVIDSSNTQRYVRKPDVQPCFLSVRTSEQAALTVEVEGQQVIALPLQPGQNHFPLKALFGAERHGSKLLSLVPGMGRSKPIAEPSAFTVFINQGTPDGTLLGTYNFRLMTEAEFDQAYGKCNGGDCEGRQNASRQSFTTDERSPETARDCWNCKQAMPLNTRYCLKCGYDQEEEHDQE